MADPDDYSQPDFFRFGWDALFLVKEVLVRTQVQAPLRLLELGAGSGVISCEFSQNSSVANATLVEVQREEWSPHLQANLLKFGKFAQTPTIFWGTVSEFNPAGEEKFDLILSNPPYFDPQRGRPSPDPRRNIAHRLMLDDWESWLACMGRSLAVGGEAWYLQKDPGPVRGKLPLPENCTLKHEVRSGPMRLLCLRRL